jgi:hypothetical protein
VIDAKALITHTFDFENAVDVFRGIIGGTQPIVKAVMKPNG